jgi:hypothetical protein
VDTSTRARPNTFLWRNSQKNYINLRTCRAR